MRATDPLLPLLCLVLGALVVDLALAAPDSASGPLVLGRQGGRAEVRALSRIYVKRLRFKGQTILPESELRLLTAPFEGRAITWQELEGLRQTISSYYLQQGYLNSGVLLDDQQVKDGEITLTVIAGTLSAIAIHDNRALRTSYLRERIERGAASPLNVNALRQNLQLLQQDPGIRRINAELRPGLSLGEGVLEVTVEEAPPFRVGLAADNGKSPAIGDLHGVLELERRNLLGVGDSLQGSFGLTDGETSEYAVTASVPLNPSDTTVRIHTSRTEGTLVEEPFTDLEIRNQSSLWRLGVTHPLWREPAGELRLGLAFDLLDHETSLLGRPFAFFEGTDDGRSALAIWRLTQEYVKRGPSRVLAFSSSFNLGENRTSGDEAEPSVGRRFSSWTGQGKLVTRHRLLGREVQAVLRSDIQLTGDSLIPSERHPVGGMNSVRGYRENSFMRDNGLFGSLELRVPVAMNPREDRLTARLVPFLDLATAWNTRAGERERREVASVGLGLFLSHKEWLDCRIFLGMPLVHRDTVGASLQDRGIHFQVRLSL